MLMWSPFDFLLVGGRLPWAMWHEHPILDARERAVYMLNIINLREYPGFSCQHASACDDGLQERP